MKFTLWHIVFLLHSLGIPICVVYVEVIFDMCVGSHGGHCVNTLACRGRRFLADHCYNIVRFHNTASWFSKNSIG